MPGDISLDQHVQRALAYLSGIPVSNEPQLEEKITNTSDELQTHFRTLMDTWLELQQEEIHEIGTTLVEVLEQLNLNNKKVVKRLQSREYLSLVRKAFRNWAATESETKRILMRNLLVNASSEKSSPDFAISLFIDWLAKYSDEHLSILQAISGAKPEGLTRYQIWHKLHDYQPGEDSAEGDLYRMLILDLSSGHLIRQARAKDFHGRFIKSLTKTEDSPDTSNSVLISTFDNKKNYVLTELGQQFAHYTSA